jgi:uncharacterized membrane protein
MKLGARVRAGDGLTDDQRTSLGRVLRSASESSDLTYRLYVGALQRGRESALEQLAACGADAADTVLVAVDPGARALEIVTGSRAAASLGDRACGLAALAMTSSFSAGDLVGGVRNGVQILADHARHQPRRHLETL